MRPQAVLRRRWTSMVRCGFALTVLVLVPVLAAERALLLAHRFNAPRFELKQRLQSEHEMERLRQPAVPERSFIVEPLPQR